MDIVLVLAAVVVGVIVVVLAAPYFWYRRSGKRMFREFDEYLGLRRQYMAGPSLTSDRTFGETADAIVARLGPRFDPRLTAWSRLGSAEPSLLAYVTNYIDPSVEDPLDLEAFADSILLITLSPRRWAIGSGHWRTAMESCLKMAAEWRVAQPGRYPNAASPPLDTAMEEAAVVTSRFFRSGDWRWDFEDDVVVEQPGSPPSGPVVTPLTLSKGAVSADQVAIAPEIGPPSPSGSPHPGAGAYRTRADRTLQLDTFVQLTFQVGFLSALRPMPDCENAYVGSIEQIDATAWPGEPPLDVFSAGSGTTWFERWTLDCGGTSLPFAVAFMRAPSGGTTLSVELIE